jgi:hypothetical protein
MSAKTSSLTKKQDLLRRAEELMGRDRLAKRLGTAPAMLEAWMRGDVTMPDGKLLDLAAALAELADHRKS